MIKHAQKNKPPSHKSNRLAKILAVIAFLISSIWIVFLALIILRNAINGSLQKMTYIDTIAELIFVPGRIIVFVSFIIWFFAFCATRSQEIHEKYLSLFFTGIAINQILVFFVNFAQPFGWKVLVVFAVLTLLNFLVIITIAVVMSKRAKSRVAQ